MNSLSVQNSGMAQDDLVYRVAQLPPHLREEMARRAVEWGVQRGIEEWRANRHFGMAELGQDALSKAVSTAVERAIKPLIPTLGAELLKAVKPAAEAAANIVGPAVAEELEKKAPAIAIATGLIAGLVAIGGMLLLGQWVVRKVRK